MKDFRLLLLLGIGFLVGNQSLFALGNQSKAEKKERQKVEIREAVEKSQWLIDIERALPMGSKSINLSSFFTLEMKGDSVYSHLPYYGRAYSVPYGGGDGLRFKEPMTDYKCVFDKKGNAEMDFRVKTSEDVFTFNVKIFTNGSAMINVSPVNRQSISYTGKYSFKEKP